MLNTKNNKVANIYMKYIFLNKAKNLEGLLSLKKQIFFVYFLQIFSLLKFIRDE